MQNKKLLYINFVVFIAFMFVVFAGVQKMNHRQTNHAATDHEKIGNEKSRSHALRPDYTYIPKHKNDFAIIFHKTIESSETEEERIIEGKNESASNHSETENKPVETNKPSSESKSVNPSVRPKVNHESKPKEKQDWIIEELKENKQSTEDKSKDDENVVKNADKQAGDDLSPKLPDKEEQEDEGDADAIDNGTELPMETETGEEASVEP
ncbi:hypothetical protein ACLIBH_09835 [Virgibacillus sp. W0430]|uniref:hypothetical protein n=1 Tax=Virgibacillus sp. W0430 TaxID=3391580 RepID=UPI003F459BD9